MPAAKYRPPHTEPGERFNAPEPGIPERELRSFRCPGVGSGGLPQRHHGEHTEDADGDEHAFHDPGGHVAEHSGLAVLPQRGKQYDGGADVRDDQHQLADHADEDAGVCPGSGEVLRVGEQGCIQQGPGDGRDEGEEGKDSGGACGAAGGFPWSGG